jgi:ankyrin repeat protein
MLASLTGNEEAVRFLLEHAAHAGMRDKAGDSALVCALFNRYERIAAMLRAAGAHD